MAAANVCLHAMNSFECFKFPQTLQEIDPIISAFFFRCHSIFQYSIHFKESFLPGTKPGAAVFGENGVQLEKGKSSSSERMTQGQHS